jgi:transglutaminase-like putative cysteine protease
MTLLAVRHVTTYRYKQPVSFGEHRIMFRPRDSYDQRLLDSRIEINPAPSGLRWIHDVFGNCVTIAHFSKEAPELRFESNICLDHMPSNAPDFQMEEYAQIYPFAYSAEEMPDLMRTMERRYLDPDHQIHRWVQRFIHQGRPTRTGKLLMTLTYAIKESFTYSRRLETGIQDPLTTLRLNRGSTSTAPA